MAWTSSATPRGHARPFSRREAIALPLWRLPQSPLVGRAAVVLHAVAMATLLQPQPVHAVLLLSGATLLMIVWQLRPAEATTPATAKLDAITVPAALGFSEPASPVTFSRMPVPSASQPAFDDVLAHLSHELRTPLNAVIGFADLMNAETFGPVGHPRYREYLAHIRSSGAHLLASAETTLTIAELLSASRCAPSKSAVRLADIARDLWSSDTNAAGTLEGVEVLSDRATLERALASLAVDAQPRFTAECRDDIVVLSLALSDASQPDSKASLRIAAARLLLQSVGASLLERVSDDGRRMVQITLERAAQPDIFSWQPEQKAHGSDLFRPH